MRYGLRPSDSSRGSIWPETDVGYIYLTDSFERAVRWPKYAVKEGLESIEYIDDTKPVVLRIDTTGLDRRYFSADHIMRDDWRYKGIIPPEMINIVMTGKKKRNRTRGIPGWYSESGRHALAARGIRTR
jgi:hypothetical protein